MISVAEYEQMVNHMIQIITIYHAETIHYAKHHELEQLGLTTKQIEQEAKTLINRLFLYKTIVNELADEMFGSVDKDSLKE